MSWDYTRDDSNSAAKTGIRRCVITDAKETISKSSNKPMIVITVRPSGSKATINSYIVKNDNFNRNMTQFFDAFPTITEGNFNFVEWIGAEGVANFGLKDNGYLEVKWFVSPERAGDLPPFEGEKPTQQTVEKFVSVEADDDMPF